MKNNYFKFFLIAMIIVNTILAIMTYPGKIKKSDYIDDGFFIDSISEDGKYYWDNHGCKYLFLREIMPDINDLDSSKIILINK